MASTTQAWMPMIWGGITKTVLPLPPHKPLGRAQSVNTGDAWFVHTFWELSSLHSTLLATTYHP